MKSKIYVTGHLPDNINNPFFKWWLKEYFSKTNKVSAFRILENFMDIHYNEDDLISSMGTSKYNRSYKTIPDYVDYGNEERQRQMFRNAYLADFDISPPEPKFPWVIGFDKAKE
jgi:hypothetical protein